MSANIQNVKAIQSKTRVSRQLDIVKAGSVSALLIAGLLMMEMVVYLVTSAPSLADPAGWFNLFQNHRLVGLLDFGIIELYGLMLFVPLFAALLTALKGENDGAMIIASGLAFSGIAANFATSKLFSLLTLSDLYAVAATQAMKAQFLAAGQAALAVSALGGISGSVEGGIPLAVAGLIISVVVLRSNRLGKALGIIGLLANGCGLVMYLYAAAAPTPNGSPFFGPFFLSSIIWFVLIGLSLFRQAAARRGDD